MHPIQRIKVGDVFSEYDLLWNPQLLYHYTTREGLLGILCSGTVWATNIRFLNDASEFTYAQEMFVQKLGEIKDSVDPKYSDELTDAMGHISALTPDIFVFCLSRCGDLLSQWRAYGQPGNGYSIGFDAPALDEIVRMRREMKLAAVVYDQRQQWEMMNQMEFKAVDGSRSTASRTFGEVLRGTFLDAGPRMKHLAFEEESEWRVVLLHGKRSSLQVKHRPGRSMLVPYVSVRLGTKERPMPIQEIIIGPNPHPDLDSEAVKGLCRQCGMNIEVRNSRIPYRAF